jgi:hypothetical protein
MRNVLKIVGLMALVALAPAYARAQEAPAEPPAESAQPTPESDPYSLEGALDQLEQALDIAKAAAKAARDSTGLAAEGLALMSTINAEAVKVAELESKCFGGDSAECAQAKRERCPVLGASYRRIEERFATFDEKVAGATLPADVTTVIVSTSAQIKAGIKMLKEQLERGSCIDA